MNPVSSLLADGRPHLFDGAMGTVLYERGVFVNICYDELSLVQPELVRSIHEEYVVAGAEIVETNTFGANPVKLSAYGLEGRTEEINERAAIIAREAGALSVAGAVGPLGVRIEPLGPTAREEAVSYFARQIAGLLEGGVDCLVLETFSDLSEILCAITAWRRLADLPVFAQMTLEERGLTAYGASPAKLAHRLAEAGADVVGLNCSVGPAVMLDGIEEMAGAVDLPLSAQPNAGLPRRVRDRKIYMASPDYMARYARRLVEAGARFVGGCCGTSPEHIRRAAELLETNRERSSDPVSMRRHSAGGVGTVRVLGEVARPAGSVPSALRDRSAWGRWLADGRRLVSVELPPTGGWPEPARELTGVLGELGAGAIQVPDLRRRGQLGPVAATAAIRPLGVECIAQYACRGSGMFEMVSDLLGAAILGVRNLLVVSGDPSPFGPYSERHHPFDVDSIGLANIVSGLNKGEGPGGESTGAPTDFVLGVAANPHAADQALEAERFAYKVEAGGEFVVTPPIFDARVVAEFFGPEAARPVVAGVRPLRRLRDAEMLGNELSEVAVPPAVMDRMRRAELRGGARGAREEGFFIALEIMEQLAPFVAGYHFTGLGVTAQGLQELRRLGDFAADLGPPGG